MLDVVDLLNGLFRAIGKHDSVVLRRTTLLKGLLSRAPCGTSP